MGGLMSSTREDDVRGRCPIRKAKGEEAEAGTV